MATYLYGRCSTQSQDTDNQLSKLREQYPAAEVIEETASGIKSRPKLKELIERLQKKLFHPVKTKVNAQKKMKGF